MNVGFRVTARSFDGLEYIYELFEDRGSADRFYDGLEKGDFLDRVPVAASVLTMEELYNGSWVVLRSRTVL